jgi:hypothetical protein
MNNFVSPIQQLTNQVSKFSPYLYTGLPTQGGLAVFRIAVYDGQDNNLKYSWTFPISPQMYTKTVVSMSNYYDVAGNLKNGGVRRIVDQYGVSPPVWTFRGTTGYKYHPTDGVQFSGMQSLLTLFKIIQRYGGDQAQNAKKGLKLDIMEFSDYYQQEFWYVVPVGPQGMTRSASAPIIGNYSITLVGISDVGSSSSFYPLDDPVLNLLSSTDPSFQAQQAVSLADAIVSYYGLPE